MAITRGYSYGSAEDVTSGNLHRLIESAKVSGLSAADFSGDVRGIVTATDVSLANGSVMFQFEPPVGLERPAGYTQLSHPTYLVKSRGSYVCLFGGDRMETNRLTAGGDFGGAGGDQITKGQSVHFDGQAGSGSVTILAGLGSGSVPLAYCLGPTRGLVDVTGDAVRTTILGYAAAKLSANDAGPVWFDAIWGETGSGSDFAKSTATDHSGQVGMRLNNVGDAGGGTGRIQPAYMLGSLCFRE
jgi:hypothetical protein